jgi:hypothetical protein
MVDLGIRSVGLVKLSLELIKVGREVSFDFFLSFLFHLGNIFLCPLVHGFTDGIRETLFLFHNLEVGMNAVDCVLFCQLLGHFSTNEVL